MTCTEDYFLEDGMFSSQTFLEKCQPLDLHVATLEDLVEEINVTGLRGLHPTVHRVNVSNEPSTKRSKEHCNGDEKQTCLNNTDLHPTANRVFNDNELSTKRSKTLCEGDPNQTLYGENCVGAASTDLCYPSCDTDSYILDVDLDFFSVTNPFLQDYTEV